MSECTHVPWHPCSYHETSKQERTFTYMLRYILRLLTSPCFSPQLALSGCRQCETMQGGGGKSSWDENILPLAPRPASWIHTPCCIYTHTYTACTNHACPQVAYTAQCKEAMVMVIIYSPKLQTNKCEERFTGKSPLWMKLVWINIRQGFNNLY